VLLIAGVQMLTLGIVGEYVGKVYDEVRARPSFIVAERIGAGVPEDLESRLPRQVIRQEAADGAPREGGPR